MKMPRVLRSADSFITLAMIASAALASLASMIGESAYAQAASTSSGLAYPAKPIRYVVAFAAGNFVAKSAPDGHTLLHCNIATNAIALALYRLHAFRSRALGQSGQGHRPSAAVIFS